MKKILVSISLILGLVGCGSGSGTVNVVQNNGDGNPSVGNISGSSIDNNDTISTASNGVKDVKPVENNRTTEKSKIVVDTSKKGEESSNQTSTLNESPKVYAGDNQDVIVNKGVTLKAPLNKTYDLDGDIVKYEWTENGVVIGSEWRINYSPKDVGRHTIWLTVTDNDRATAKDYVLVDATYSGHKSIIDGHVYDLDDVGNINGIYKTEKPDQLKPELYRIVKKGVKPLYNGWKTFISQDITFTTPESDTWVEVGGYIYVDGDVSVKCHGLKTLDECATRYTQILKGKSPRGLYPMRLGYYKENGSEIPYRMYTYTSLEGYIYATVTSSLYMWGDEYTFNETKGIDKWTTWGQNNSSYCGNASTTKECLKDGVQSIIDIN